MNTYKNFIDKKICKQINNTMLGVNFPWFYKKNQTGKDSSFLFHCFFAENKINSTLYYLIEPLVKKLNPSKLVNIRANLCLKRPMKSNWHSDFDNLKSTPKSKTAIYYVNTNNGYTIFKNKKIKSEQNKMIVFNGDTKHKVKYQTDKDTRIVINFLYESI
tara:strand:- start:287 stop:766 length:480 start_codon:yes stop_codon:yes gene_type:complete